MLDNYKFRKAVYLFLLLVIILFAGIGYLFFNLDIHKNVSINKGDNSYNDYSGIINVHSAYSNDGSWSIKEIAEAATQAGVDFVIINDNNTLEGLKRKEEGWYKDVLILIGAEISTSLGYYLVFDVPPDFIEKLPSMEGKVVIDECIRRKGFGIIAHSYSRLAWKDWSVGYTGLEIIDAADEFWSSSLFDKIMAFYLYPFNPFYAMLSLTGGYRKGLKIWDELSQKIKLIGVYGSDAHGTVWITKKYFLKFPLFENIFKIGKIHIVTRDKFKGELNHDKKLIYNAIKRGNFYNSIDILGNSAGFLFFARNSIGETAIMGESMTAGLWIEFNTNIKTTKNLHIILIRNGESVLSRVNDFKYRTTQKGTYRIEVYLDIKTPFGVKRFPWILSNPIYVK